MAKTEKEAIEGANQRLKEQFGPQERRVYKYETDDRGALALTETGHPVVSKDYDVHYDAPMGKLGYPDETLLQEHYRLLSVEVVGG